MKIRGEEINLEIFKEDIEYFETLEWSFSKWKPRPAIRDKSGSTSKFVGQKYDSKFWQYLEEGWNHDHCEICSLAMFESDNSIEAFGYTNDHEDWICHECFSKIILKNFKKNEFVLKHKMLVNHKERAILLISPMLDSFNFKITENSNFGEYEIEEYLDIPRKILDNGKQDLQTFAIQLKKVQDIEYFEENRLYQLSEK